MIFFKVNCNSHKIITFANKIIRIMDNIGQRIRKYREQKGFSQEYMAIELEISQASYARLENHDSKLDVQRLMKIADILQVHFAQLIGEEPQNVFHQKQNIGPSGYFEKIENLYSDNQETIQKLIHSKDETIAKLEADLEFLRALLSSKLNL